jgi:hypothetical protein
MGKTKDRFYRWKNRYSPKRLTSLEPGSTTPKKKREPEYSRDLAAKVLAIRKEYPTYSGKRYNPFRLELWMRRISPRFQHWTGL